MSMDLSTERLRYLLQRFAAESCTPEELLELMEAMERSDNDAALHRSLQDIWEDVSDADALPELDKEGIFGRVTGRAAVVPLSGSRVLWRRASVAASVILLLGVAGYWYARREREMPAAPVVAAAAVVKKDVGPGGNKAILTLSDGTDIVLDSVREGTLSQQGGTMVMKKNGGELAYVHGRETGGVVSYNKVATPRGGKYMVTLPDGSRVWLNAASALRFPTAFVGNDRTVELWGEAYFEIEKDKSKPFYVKANNMQVAVLGTSFDVMAYEEENVVRTTLLDGAVQVTGASGDHLRLSPGQEAHYEKDGMLKLIKDVATDEAVAWKNDLFYFRGTDIQSIMRQLARWYDIDVSYNGTVSGRFYAKIPRNTNLSIVLRALALTNKLNFTQEGKKVTVTP